MLYILIERKEKSQSDTHLLQNFVCLDQGFLQLIQIFSFTVEFRQSFVKKFLLFGTFLHVFLKFILHSVDIFKLLLLPCLFILSLFYFSIKDFDNLQNLMLRITLFLLQKQPSSLLLIGFEYFQNFLVFQILPLILQTHLVSFTPLILLTLLVLGHNFRIKRRFRISSPFNLSLLKLLSLRNLRMERVFLYKSRKFEIRIANRFSSPTLDISLLFLQHFNSLAQFNLFRLPILPRMRFLIVLLSCTLHFFLLLKSFFCALEEKLSAL